MIEKTCTTTKEQAEQKVIDLMENKSNSARVRTTWVKGCGAVVL